MNKPIIPSNIPVPGTQYLTMAEYRAKYYPDLILAPGKLIELGYIASQLSKKYKKYFILTWSLVWNKNLRRYPSEILDMINWNSMYS